MQAKLSEEEKAFLRAISQGLIDVHENRVLSVSEARKKLGLFEHGQGEYTKTCSKQGGSSSP